MFYTLTCDQAHFSALSLTSAHISQTTSSPSFSPSGPVSRAGEHASARRENASPNVTKYHVKLYFYTSSLVYSCEVVIFSYQNIFSCQVIFLHIKSCTFSQIVIFSCQNISFQCQSDLCQVKHFFIVFFFCMCHWINFSCQEVAHF